MKSGCPFTLDELRAALGDPADSPRIRALAQHLEAGCPTCAALFEKTEAGALLEHLAGPGVALPPGEVAGLFGAIQEKLGSRARAPIWRRRWIMAAAAAVLLVACGGLALFLASRSPLDRPGPDGKGLKGDQPPKPVLSVTLRGFVGAARPGALRPIGEGESLRSGEVLFFRVDLSAAAFCYLVHVESRELLFFPDPGAEPMPAGEYELTSGGRALALPADRFPKGGTLLLLATRVTLSPQALESMLARAAPEESVLCPGCAHDKIRLGKAR